jgi:hypothetical protein
VSSKSCIASTEAISLAVSSVQECALGSAGPDNRMGGRKIAVEPINATPEVDVPFGFVVSYGEGSEMSLV